MDYLVNLIELKSCIGSGCLMQMTAALIFAGYLIAGQTAPAGSQNISQGQGSSNQPSSVAATTTPEKAPLLPPALPDRSVPQVPAQAPAPRVPSWAKASLAWRQKALKLSNEKFKSASDQKTDSPLLRTYDAIYPDMLMALNSACSECGFRVDSLNSNAGEVLAISQDGQIKLVFSVWEQAEGKCWIYAGIEKGNTAAAAKNATSILDTVFNTNSKRGRI